MVPLKGQLTGIERPILMEGFFIPRKAKVRVALLFQ